MMSCNIFNDLILYKPTCIYNDTAHIFLGGVGDSYPLIMAVDVVQVGTGTTKHLPSLNGSDKHILQLPVFFSFFVKNIAVVWKRKLGCLRQTLVCAKFHDSLKTS